jgi:hypothetical protein
MAPNAKQELKLTLTLEEVNFVIRALSERSFKDVYELIGKINMQANSQLMAQNATPKQDDEK